MIRCISYYIYIIYGRNLQVLGQDAYNAKYCFLSTHDLATEIMRHMGVTDDTIFDQYVRHLTLLVCDAEIYDCINNERMLPNCYSASLPEKWVKSAPTEITMCISENGLPLTTLK